MVWCRREVWEEIPVTRIRRRVRNERGEGPMDAFIYSHTLLLGFEGYGFETGDIGAGWARSTKGCSTS